MENSLTSDSWFKLSCLALLCSGLLGLGHVAANFEILGKLFGEWIIGSPAAAVSLIALWIISPVIQLAVAIYCLSLPERTRIPRYAVVITAAILCLALWGVKAWVFSSTNPVLTFWGELFEGYVYGSDGIRGDSLFASAASAGQLLLLPAVFLSLRARRAKPSIDNHSQ